MKPASMRNPSFIFTAAILIAIMTIFIYAPAFAQVSLPIAQPWEIISNGFRGELRINSINEHGILAGSWTEGSNVAQINGLWDEASKKILFVRTLGGDSTIIQVYTGYLFSGQGYTFCQVGDIKYMLAGSFEAFPNTGATAQRNVFGWAARYCTLG